MDNYANELKNKIDKDDSENNAWGEIAFERQTDQELSLQEKKDLINFFKEKDGKNEYDGYRIFITDVENEPTKKFSHDEIISSIPEVCNLGAYNPNGFMPDENEYQKRKLKDVDFSKTPLAFSSDDTFTHIRFFGNHEMKNNKDMSEEIYCRFYICPELDSIPQILPKLIEKYQEKGLCLTAKFARTDERNDRMVIYSDEKTALMQLEALKELIVENPELFQNLGKNRLWGKIEGVEGIYFGQDCPYSKFISYSEDRARIVGETATVLRSLEEKGIEINDVIIDAIFSLVSLSRCIDTKSWSKYSEGKDKKELASQAGDLLYAITYPEELEYLVEEIDIDAFSSMFPGLRGLLEYLKNLNGADN